ncbi:MAG: hypothetical protein HC765_07030, partial [Brachymonas sp.]|nr:hypothetical protein [Brachymonas sp.]
LRLLLLQTLLCDEQLFERSTEASWGTDTARLCALTCCAHTLHNKATSIAAFKQLYILAFFLKFPERMTACIKTLAMI